MPFTDQQKIMMVVNELRNTNRKLDKLTVAINELGDKVQRKDTEYQLRIEDYLNLKGDK